MLSPHDEIGHFAPRCAILIASLFLGCSSATDTAGVENRAPSSASTPSDPIASAAFDFLDAVIAGDTERATLRLTPQAVQQFEVSGKRFAPPGLGTASFRIGEVRKASTTQAAVQCLLTDAAEDGGQTEELCCLMRWVEGRWLVSGIAYELAADQPPMILDFEKVGSTPSLQPPPTPGQFVGPGNEKRPQGHVASGPAEGLNR